MTYFRRKCKRCGKSGLQLSRKGNCIDCSIFKVVANAKQLREKKGKQYLAWKKGVLSYIRRK